MISKIIIRNFQKHKKKVILFDKGITTFIGDTDTGKSAILRAISWVLFNTPNGVSFIHRKKKYASVSLHIDGNTVTRTRSRSGVNLYKINGKVLKSFGHSVPKEISKLCNVSSNINFQSQYQNAYWLFESGGNVSKKLNEIVNLEMIDKVLSSIKSDITHDKGVSKIIIEQLKEERENLSKLKQIKKIQKEFQVLLNMGVVLKNIESKIKEAETLSNAIERRQIELPDESIFLDISKLDNIDEILQSVEEAIELLHDISKEKTTVECEISQLLKSISNINNCPVCGKPMKEKHNHE